jgi:dihydropyrimidinase
MGSLFQMRSSRRVFVASAACLATALLMQSGATEAQQSAAELVIRNGLIVNDTGRLEADIRIKGEKIVEIAAKLKAGSGAKEIDAKGMLLLPGAIDTHTHLSLEPVVRPVVIESGTNAGAVDDFTDGSKAALAGGITTISNFVAMKNDEDPNAFADRVIKAIETYAIADVYPRALVLPLSTSKGAPPDPLTQKKTYDALVARGIVGTGEDRMASAQFDRNSLAWVKKFRASAQAGIVSAVHAEDYAINTEAQERLMSENGGAGGTIHNFSQAFPEVAEVLAVQRAVAISEATGAAMIIDHISSGRALKVVEDAQRRGLPIYGEVRPEYLHATSQKYAQPDADLWLGGPPMRDKWDQDMIWDAIRRGVLHTVGTDHSGFPKSTKLDPANTVVNRRMGIPNLQEYPAMMFSDGVVKDRITLEQFVAVTSTNTAKIFGMYPRKGVIQVGSDADIVIWNPTKKKVLKDANMLSGAGYTAYAGTEVTGMPITTIRRGEVVYDKEKIVGKAGSGRFIAGARFQRPTLRPVSN